MNTEFEWWNDTESNDGTDWFLMAEDDYLAENYWAKASGNSPFTWEVGMGFPEGISLAKGKADTLEQAQQQAVQAWSRAVAE